jgi:putative ABC transport system permease protein
MRRSRFTTRELLLTHVTARSGAARLVVLLIFVTTLVLALAPRAIPLLGDAQLQHELARLAPVDRGFFATGDFRLPSVERGKPADATNVFGPVDSALATLPERLDPPLASLIGTPDWLIETSAQRTAPPNSDGLIVLTMSLAMDLDWQSRIHFVEGAPPMPWVGTGEDAPPIEIALSADAADDMSVRVGDLLDYSPAPLLVSGTYEIVDPDEAYWSFAGLLAEARQTAVPKGSFFTAEAYVHPDSAAGLTRLFNASTVAVWFPIDVADIHFAESAGLLEQIRSTRGLGISLPSGGHLVATTGMGSALEDAKDSINAFTALIVLAASGPIGILLAVNTLGVQAMLERRRPALALATARGASGMKLRLAMLLEGALVTLPATVLAIVIAALTLPTHSPPMATILPALFAITMLALFVALTPTQNRPVRSDAGGRSRARYRWVVEVSVAGFAGLSVLLLTRRGLIDSSAAIGIDPLITAMPLLLAATMCLVVLRLYPVPLKALHRGMRLRRGAVGMIGSANAVREPTLGFVAAFTLVVGMTFAVFSGVLSTTVTTAIQSTAAAEVGADIRIEAHALDDEVLAEVALVDGVNAVAGLGIARPVTVKPRDGRESTVTVVFADAEALQAIWAEVPGNLATRLGTRIPILISSDLAGQESLEAAQLGASEVSVVGVLPETALRWMTQRWVLVDRVFASEVSGTPFDAIRALAAVDDGTDPSTVAAHVHTVVAAAQRNDRDADNVGVFDSSTQRDEMVSTPVIVGLQFVLAVAAVAGLLLSSLAVVIAAVASTATRRQTVGVLRTLGLSTRQANSLTVWDLAPVAVTALCAGIPLGLALPWVVTAIIDLRPFVGGAVSPTPSVDPSLVCVTAVLFALVVFVAGAFAVAVARRLQPGEVLRMGAE